MKIKQTTRKFIDYIDYIMLMCVS